MNNISNDNEVAKILIDIGAVKFDFENKFILTSGKKSPVYIDCRRIISFINERNKILEIAEQYIKKNNIKFDILAGGETAGIPYASFLSQIFQKPMIYVRKKPKEFGKNKQIEGNFKQQQKVLLIEDLATDGGSKVNFIEALRNSKLLVSDIFVIFYYDIFDLNKSPLGSMNISIHSLCTWKDIINFISKNNIYTQDKIENLKLFLSDPELWREKNE